MIYVIGIGPGLSNLLTPLATEKISKASVVIGSTRQLELVTDKNINKRLLDNKLSDLIVWLKENRDKNIAVLASGDPMLYGIGKLIKKELKDEEVLIVPGISSVQYLFSKLGLDMNDLYLTSTHGKEADFDFLLKHKKVSLMTDKHMGPFEIAQEIVKRNLNRTLIIGEMLSYPDEKITVLEAKDVLQLDYKMNVVVILDER